MVLLLFGVVSIVGIGLTGLLLNRSPRTLTLLSRVVSAVALGLPQWCAAKSCERCLCQLSPGSASSTCSSTFKSASSQVRTSGGKVVGKKMDLRIARDGLGAAILQQLSNAVRPGWGQEWRGSWALRASYSNGLGTSQSTFLASPI